MNDLATTFADLTRTLENFTAVPLAADFFSWCDETDTFPHIRWSLSALGVSFNTAEPVSDLRARIERKLETETRKGERGHWTFDANRLVALRQMLRAIKKFEVA